jgi:tetratricopeptide (TPR) repeat protein
VSFRDPNASPSSPQALPPRPGAHFRGLVLGPASVRLALSAGLLLAVLLVVLSPLTGVPGIESALALGLVLPPFVAAAGARLSIAARADGIVGPGALLARAARVAAGSVLLPTAVLAMNGLRVRWCAPLEGLAFVALGPGIGALLAAFIGVLVGAVVPGPRWATAIAATVPIAAALASATVLYTTPAIFAYGHFYGYFPGTLYDPDITIEEPYLTFRALSAAWIVGLAALTVAIVDRETARPSLPQARRAPGALAVALFAVAAGIAGEVKATDLGHRSTSESIRERLGATLRGRRCDVVVPREIPRDRAERLRDDCDFRVAQAAQRLGVEPPARVTAFFFRSASEKRALMGASGTFIAKPWRREVYLQLGGWPHPVLAHEIVHVVAGEVGAGPFRISGRWGGWLPSPGVIEGLAVAVAWEAREGLTPHEWARAMLELGLTPSIARTEGIGFLAEPASRAYTASGSFVRWIFDQRGAAAVRALYRSGEYGEVLGMSLAEAEREWRAWLTSQVELRPEALALAEARFERPAIFAQVCPHRVARLMEIVEDEMAAGDELRAIETCEKILEIDPRDATARARLAVALAREGDFERARRELDRLAGPPSAARSIVRAARQGIADALWAAERTEEAARLFRAILQEPLSDEDARQVEVRLLAIEGGMEGGEHLREVFAPPPDRPHDSATAMYAIAQVRQARPDGLGAYLAARQLMQRERYDLAAGALAEAIERGLPTERLRREARRIEAIIAFANGWRRRSREIWEAIAVDPSSTEAARVEARDWLERIAWTGLEVAPVAPPTGPTPTSPLPEEAAPSASSASKHPIRGAGIRDPDAPLAPHGAPP